VRAGPGLRDRLTAAGASEAELDRVRGPVGLDLGARTPAETAVSVVAEVLARRGGRTPAALGATAGRIGV
jgi:xanthine dehydrogenase accessory factor